MTIRVSNSVKNYLFKVHEPLTNQIRVYSCIFITMLDFHRSAIESQLQMIELFHHLNSPTQLRLRLTIYQIQSAHLIAQTTSELKSHLNLDIQTQITKVES